MLKIKKSDGYKLQIRPKTRIQTNIQGTQKTGHFNLLLQFICFIGINVHK